MDERRYATAYWWAKAHEVWGKIVIFASPVVGLYIWGSTREVLFSFLIGFGVFTYGVACVILAQLWLCFIDTENNTRQTHEQLQLTNQMLSETLGRIAASLDRRGAVTRQPDLGKSEADGKPGGSLYDM